MIRKLNRRFSQAIILIKYVFCLTIAPFWKRKYEDVWLISERGDSARDNGYVFYKYLKKNHKTINVKYVITDDSRDRNRIDDEDVVIFGSLRHMLYFINAGKLISTHIMGFSPNIGMFAKLDVWGLIYTRGKRIFLQHGIVYNHVLPIDDAKVDLFITSTLQEKKFIIKYNHIDEGKIKCTGLARYDNLKRNPKDIVLLAPTWRANLFFASERQFKESEYFREWNAVIKNEQFKQFLEKNKMKAYLYVHHEVQNFCDCFDVDNEYIKLANFEKDDISSLIMECKILVTDYSSTLFDAAYLKIPAIYYQFDYDKFYSEHYGEGYLKLSKDGFGRAVNNLKDLIRGLEKIAENGFRMGKKYEKRVDDFFEFHDTKQCERIYNEIIKLDDGKL